MKNTIKCLEEVFASELNTRGASTRLGCTPQLAHNMKKSANHGKYPSLSTMCSYLEKAGYEVTIDFIIVKR